MAGICHPAADSKPTSIWDVLDDGKIHVFCSCSFPLGSFIPRHEPCTVSAATRNVYVRLILTHVRETTYNRMLQGFFYLGGKMGQTCAWRGCVVAVCAQTVVHGCSLHARVQPNGVWSRLAFGLSFVARATARERDLYF